MLGCDHSHTQTAFQEMQESRQPIIELDIHRSIKAAKGTTAAGEDNLPTVALDTPRKCHRQDIQFNTSMNLGYHPKQ